MSHTSKVLVSGPFAGFAVGFAAELGRLGYSPRTVEAQLRLMKHLSGWLVVQGLSGDVQLLAFILLMSVFAALQLVSVKSGVLDRNPRDSHHLRRAVRPMVIILAVLAVFPWSMLI